MIEVGRDFERMQDFIVGRLSDDEHRAFEDRLAREPGLVHELEQSLRLSEGLHQLRAQGYFDKAASRARGSRIWLPLLAAAAIAGLALFLRLQPSTGPLPVLTASLDSRAPAVGPSVAAHFTFVAVRDSSTPDLNLPSGGVIEFRAAPATHLTRSRYRMTLVRQDEGGASKPVGGRVRSRLCRRRPPGTRSLPASHRARRCNPRHGGSVPVQSPRPRSSANAVMRDPD